MFPVQCSLDIPFPFQVFSVTQNQIVDGMAEVCEEFSARDVHRAQNRAIVAGGAGLITRCDISRELAHPVGLWDGKHVGMLTQAPRKNASSRPWRAHNENRFINLLVHSSGFWGAVMSFSVYDGFSPAMGFRRIHKLPPPQDDRVGKVALRSSW